MVVDVTTGDSFTRLGPSRILFPDTYSINAIHDWDISLDGQRFLMIKPDTSGRERPDDQQFTIVQNWFEELTRLVPVP